MSSLQHRPQAIEQILTPKHLRALNPHFDLGELVSDPDTIEQAGEVLIRGSMKRFAHGDWGDVYSTQRQQNEKSLANGFGPLVGIYGNLAIVTEGNRRGTYTFFAWNKHTTSLAAGRRSQEKDALLLIGGIFFAGLAIGLKPQIAKPLVIGAIGLVIAQKIHTMFSREPTGSEATR